MQVDWKVATVGDTWARGQMEDSRRVGNAGVQGGSRRNSMLCFEEQEFRNLNIPLVFQDKLQIMY